MAGLGSYEYAQQFEIASTHRWKLSIGPGGLTSILLAPFLNIPLGGEDSDGVSITLKYLFEKVNVMNYAAESSDLPSLEMKMKELEARGIKVWKNVGTEASGEFSFTFMDDNDRMISRLFEYWQRLGANAGSGMRLPQSFRYFPLPITLTLYNNQWKKVQTYTMNNITIKSVEKSSPTAVAEFSRSTVTITYTGLSIL